jgi:hypothetical protein
VHYGSPTADVYAGIYRAVVVGTDDPERRKRYRVRVNRINPESVAAEALPWAEVSTFFGGKFFGEIPNYHVHDVVWVMFEAGDKRYPVIVGAPLAYTGGVPDVPSEVTADYARTGDRWIRLDRSGNLIEMSPLPESRYIRIKSGDAELFVSESDATVESRCPDGIARRVANKIEDVCEDHVVLVDNSLFEDVKGDVERIADGAVVFRSAVEIVIGERTDPLGIIQKTPTVHVRAGSRVVVISDDEIEITSLGDLSVTSQGTTEVTSAGEMSIRVTAAGLSVRAQRVEIDADVGEVDIASVMEVKVSAPTVTVAASNVSVTGASLVELESGGNLALSAPNGIISLDAQIITFSALTTVQFDVQSALVVNVPSLLVTAQTTASIVSGGPLILDGATIVIGP